MDRPASGSRHGPGVVHTAGLDCVAVVLAWLVALLVENVVLGAVWRSEFTAAWEVTQMRRLLVPIALATLAPVSIAVVGWWRVALLASRGARLATGALAMLGAIAGGGGGLGITHGRHFASWAVRAPTVVVLVLAGVFVGARVVPRVASLARWPLRLMALGLAIGTGGWLADSLVLPRLYPAFHVAMGLACLVGIALVGLGARRAADLPARVGGPIAVVVAVLVLASAAWSSAAGRRVMRLSNMRIVVVEHGPLLGRAVELVTRLHPEPDAAASDGSAGSSTSGGGSIAPGEVARALNWSGHDIVLVTVDALRADHVSAYGYPRPTTPELDALALEGTLFEAAYCPTPHTSYSVTSMMTGKYLRPLLALGLGEDSDTWAQDLRLYGWRTAAFYPPAVFYIDQDRFPRFEREHLGFEYAKVEFADPALRERQVAEYLDAAPADRPLLLWVHFFEPHEPYVVHPDHLFMGGASRDIDAYDSEVATADEGIGRVVRLVRARRPGGVVLVTADHGEEFGEHGGRYHGTTVYEEQVHVPLVVVGPGVRRGARVGTVVQTVDLLPTALSALGIPRPARLRGRDLGPLLAGPPGAPGQGSPALDRDPGFAFAETDEQSLVASGGDRLICQRRAAACALVRPANDPLEHHDLSRDEPARFDALRAELRAVERDHGRFEAAGGPAWPEALRRGLVGDSDAAEDVASLLDDADVGIRRKAAQVCFELHAMATVPQLRRALSRDEDDEVKRWTALALVRIGAPPPQATEVAAGLLRDSSANWRRPAAQALGERGDPRACDAITGWWADIAPGAGQAGPDGEPAQLRMELSHVRDLLEATATAKCRAAVPELIRALGDVRARPYVATALGALGDDRAQAPLLELLADEAYVTTRPFEARALLALGARDWMAPASVPAPDVHATVPLPRAVLLDSHARSAPNTPRGPVRLVALLSDSSATLDVLVDQGALAEAPMPLDETVRSAELPASRGRTVRLDLHASAGGVVALWLVPTAALD